MPYNKNILLLLILGSLLFFLTGCDGTCIILTEEDNEFEVAVSMDTTVEVELKSNQTTGYLWIGPSTTGDKIIGKVTDNYIPDECPPGMVGCGGIRQYVFDIINPGKEILTWSYIDTAKDIDKQFSITLICKSIISLDHKDNGTKVDLPLGSTVGIELHANQTTGYSWSGPEITGDKITGEVTDNYIPDECPPGMVGCGGIRRYVFDIIRSGEGTLTWNYKSIDDDLAESFQISIKTIP